GEETDAHWLASAGPQDRVQLGEDRAAQGEELDVVRAAGGCTLQAVGECERQPLERIVFVMRRDREAVEIGQRVIHPYEAQLRAAQPQADGDGPDRVEHAPGPP